MQFFICKRIAFSCILKLILNNIFIHICKFMHIFHNVSEFFLMMMWNIFIFIEIFWWFRRRTSTFWRWISLFKNSFMISVTLTFTSTPTFVLFILNFDILIHIFIFLIWGFILAIRARIRRIWIRRRLSRFFFIFTFWHILLYLKS